MDKTPGMTVTLMCCRRSWTRAHISVEYLVEVGLPYFVRDRGLAKGVAQDAGVGAPVHWHACDRERKAQHRFHAGGERVGVHAPMGVEQSSIYVEEIGVAIVPAKTFTDEEQIL